MIESLRVRDFMTTQLHTTTPDCDIMTAVAQLVELDVSGLLVVDGAGKLVGMLTERDCIDVALQAGYFDEFGGSVRAFMETRIDTIHPEASMFDLAEAFARSPFRRFPVVANHELLGLVCRRDVLRALISHTWFDKPGP